MNVWIVGQYKGGEVPNVVWELQGVFPTEEKAKLALVKDNYFYFKCAFDFLFADETLVNHVVYKSELQ